MPQPAAPHHSYDRFDWRWVSVGLLFTVTGVLGADRLLHPFVDDLIVRREQVLLAAALLAGTSLFIYFLGGLLIGRMSKGRTVKEPAVGGVLSVVAVFIIQLFEGKVNIVGLIIGAPFCFILAYLGGLLGEKWQERVRR